MLAVQELFQVLDCCRLAETGDGDSALYCLHDQVHDRRHLLLEYWSPKQTFGLGWHEGRQRSSCCRHDIHQDVTPWQFLVSKLLPGYDVPG